MAVVVVVAVVSLVVVVAEQSDDGHGRSRGRADDQISLQELRRIHVNALGHRRTAGMTAVNHK